MSMALSMSTSDFLHTTYAKTRKYYFEYRRAVCNSHLVGTITWTDWMFQYRLVSFCQLLPKDRDGIPFFDVEEIGRCTLEDDSMLCNFVRFSWAIAPSENVCINLRVTLAVCSQFRSVTISFNGDQFFFKTVLILNYILLVQDPMNLCKFPKK